MLNPPIINAILSILLQRENLYGVRVDIFPSDFFGTGASFGSNPRQDTL